MNVTIIACIDKNRELGKNNELIWRLKEDMEFFKKETMGKPIVMGRNTLESLPYMLPGRKPMVLSRTMVEKKNIVIFRNIQEAIFYMANNNEEFMIIGGASIYKEFLPFATNMILTEILATDKNADTFFPRFEPSDWQMQTMGTYKENEIAYKRVRYKRK